MEIDDTAYVGVNECRQFRAMLRKNFLIKRRNKCSFAFEIIWPLFIGWLIWLFIKDVRCMQLDGYVAGYCQSQAFKVNYHNGLSLFVPVLLCFGITVVYGFSSRFILTNTVTEKETKMRETLRIMSLTQFNYAMSFFTM